jgi:pimeloyl-ACP methyl ester carboxylesterase
MPHFVTPEGTSINYETYGAAGLPPVILLHGLAADLKIWAPQIIEFQKHFQVFALDLPGHGDSDRQASYSIHALPRLIQQFMDALQVEKAHLVGLSIGSTAALLFAAQYPQSTLSLVLEGPAGGVVPLASPRGWIEYIQLKLTLMGIFAMWAVLGKQISGKIINWIGQTYKYSTLLTGMEEKVDSKALVDFSFSNADAPYGNQLGQITVPTLIIRGVDDQFPRRYSQYVKDNINALCFWLEIPEAHHLVALEKPLEFNLAAMSFIRNFQELHSKEVLVAATGLREPRMLKSRPKRTSL